MEGLEVVAMNQAESMRAQAEARRMSSFSRAGSRRSVRVAGGDGVVRSGVASEAYRKERERAAEAMQAPVQRTDDGPDRRFCG
jgi:hypothetical protein